MKNIKIQNRLNKSSHYFKVQHILYYKSTINNLTINLTRMGGQIEKKCIVSINYVQKNVDSHVLTKRYFNSKTPIYT